MRSNYLVRLAQIVILCGAVSATAFAQYGGGGTGGTTSTTYTAPKGGYSTGKAVGIGVGVAAAVAGIALYVHHRHNAANSQGSLTGQKPWARNRASLTNSRNQQMNSPIATHTDPLVGEPAQRTWQKAEAGAGDLTQGRRDLFKYYGTVSV